VGEEEPVAQRLPHFCVVNAYGEFSVCADVCLWVSSRSVPPENIAAPFSFK
jgi:hypothetical protein